MCDKIQGIDCDAINFKAVEAYIWRKDKAKYADALRCIVNHFSVDLACLEISVYC